MSQFRVYVIQPKDEMPLTDIKQKDDETLKNYMARFIAAATIHQPDEQIVHIVVVFGINTDTKFYRELQKNPISDLRDFLLLKR